MRFYLSVRTLPLGDPYLEKLSQSSTPRLSQNTRWKGLLVTDLFGWLCEGQFRSHQSTDQCDLNSLFAETGLFFPLPGTDHLIGTIGTRRS